MTLQSEGAIPVQFFTYPALLFQDSGTALELILSNTDFSTQGGLLP